MPGATRRAGGARLHRLLAFALGLRGGRRTGQTLRLVSGGQRLLLLLQGLAALLERVEPLAARAALDGFLGLGSAFLGGALALRGAFLHPALARLGGLA